MTSISEPPRMPQVRAAPQPEAQRWLFLVHVDWRWIRQRPHWFAEEARREHDVLVVYRPNPGRWRLPRNRSDVRRLAMLPLPLGRSLARRKRMRVLASIQRAWIAIVARRYKPTHVYVSHPKLFVLLPAGVRRSSTIVYDCMDDAVAMAPPSARPTILAYERALADAATSILVSSGALLARLETRHGPDVTDKVTLVQNGVELRSSRLAPTHYARGTREPIVGYAGTVARWFDFDALLEAMDVCPEIRVRIVGPRTGDEPRHDRIEYRRPVSHEELPTHLADCQALIMPFKRDEIVTAVNPVKLYEYLLYGVPVISARYGEIEDQFGEFVETYDTAAELTELFRKLADGELTARGDAAAVEEFVEASTWAVRWQAVARATERAAVRS